MSRRIVNIDLNRVEGDLEFQLELEGNTVADARCIGTLYRGFEQIMVGRAPKDSLVITPRICGICGTAHLYSAVLALEQIGGIPVPPNASRIRNLCLMAETVQSDLRQSFLFFTADFCHSRYAGHPLYRLAVEAFQPFQGWAHRGTLEHSRHMVKVVAIFGGQWPHSSYMLPGGVTTPPTAKRIVDCQAVVNPLTRWFEDQVIGGDLDSWLALASADDLWRWLERDKAADSAVGLLTRLGRSLELHRQAPGTPHMLSYGAYCHPEHWQEDGRQLWRSGFLDGDSGEVQPFDHSEIAEHVRYSWFLPYVGGRHPWQGQTIPDYQPHSDRYTWAKAPRYRDQVVQTGPLAELLIDGEPLIASLYREEGGSTWLRQFARLRRTGLLLAQMRETLWQLAANLDQPHYLAPAGELPDGEGYGLVTAARGGLGHWVRVKDGAIAQYQVVTPTAWNASPKDSSGRRGHWERSLLDIELSDPDDPLEIGHIIRSHDPCLVCTVHVMGSDRRHALRA